MRIIAWNIRAGGGRRVDEIARQLHDWQPDIVVLSEFRGTPSSQQLAASIAAMGLDYQQMTVDSAKLAANALLVASRFPLQRLYLPTPPTPPTRWLLAHIAAPQPLTLGAMHIPNYVTKQKYPYFERVLHLTDQWARKLHFGPGLLIGDTNTGMPGLDEEVPCFNHTEQEWLEALDARGWVDVFRHLKGDERFYTWYSPNGGNGFRLDEAFPNQALLSRLQDMRYEWGVSLENPDRRDALSDHAAIILDLEQ